MTEKRKHSHIYTEEQQKEFVEFALSCGNSPGTTTLLRKKFSLPYTTAYYYRRLAFGYRRGTRVPVVLAIPATTNDRLVKAVDSGKAQDRAHAATIAIEKVWKE